MNSSSSSSFSSPADNRKFINSLYEMINHEINAQGIGYSPDGTMLEIRDIDFLCTTVLPNYFRHSNLRSFVRQLNNYGFVSKPTRPSVSQCFYQKHFGRGMEANSSQIRRKPMTGEKVPKIAKLDPDGHAQDNEEEEEYDRALCTNQALTQRNMELQTRIRILEDALQLKLQSPANLPPQPPPRNFTIAMPSPLHSGRSASPHFSFTTSPSTSSSGFLNAAVALVRCSGEQQPLPQFPTFFGAGLRQSGEQVMGEEDSTNDMLKSLSWRASMESVDDSNRL